MKLFSLPQLSEMVQCPYLSDQEFQQRYFWGGELSEEEFQYFLERGWRRFGYFFFRPECPECQSCTPIRVDVDKFKPSKSQRKIIRLNGDSEVVFEDRVFQERYYLIYEAYQRERFGEESDRETFRNSFYLDGAPGKQYIYYYRGELIGIGFLDCSVEGVSSVYFAYNLNYSFLNPGYYSIMKEIEYARWSGKGYYYPGYYIKDVSRMAYKGRFKPHQLFHWGRGEWYDV